LQGDIFTKNLMDGLEAPIVLVDTSPLGALKLAVRWPVDPGGFHLLVTGPGVDQTLPSQKLLTIKKKVQEVKQCMIFMFIYM